MLRPMKLYNSQYSPRARRARICAHEVGCDLERIDMEFQKGDMRKPEYLAVNPMGKIPTLVDDDFVLWESGAICVYLATKFPEKKLLPIDPRGLAETMRWMFWHAGHYEPPIATTTYEKIVKPLLMKQETDDKRVADARVDLDRFGPLLDTHLAKNAYALGDQFTIADIMLGTSTQQGDRVGLEITARFPHIKRYCEKLEAREAWKKAG